MGGVVCREWGEVVSIQGCVFPEGCVCPGGLYTPSLWTQFLTQTCENITTVAGGKNGNIIFYLVKSALIFEAQAI